MDIPSLRLIGKSGSRNHVSSSFSQQAPGMPMSSTQHLSFLTHASVFITELGEVTLSKGSMYAYSDLPSLTFYLSSVVELFSF